MGRTKCIMLIVTYKCNLNCVYCYEPKKLAHRMTIDTAKDIIMSQLASLDKDYDKIEIQFMGGEPLIEYSLIKELSEWLWTQDCGHRELVIFASTNGTLLDDEMKAWFSKNKDKIVLGLSFDGNALMQNVNRSHSSYCVDVDYFCRTWPNQNVKMTISPYTVPSLYDGIVYLHSIGFNNIIANLALGDKITWTESSLRIYKEQLAKLTEFYVENENVKPCSIFNLDICSIISKKRTHKTCSCGEDFMCYDWDGEAYACHLFSPVTISREMAIIAKENINFNDHSTFTSQTCKKCVLVELCSRCPGINYMCSQDVSTPSSFHCRAFKIEYVANCKLHLLRAIKNNDYELIKQISRVIDIIKF